MPINGCAVSGNLGFIQDADNVQGIETASPQWVQRHEIRNAIGMGREHLHELQLEKPGRREGHIQVDGIQIHRCSC